jgi:hypothetical protein
MSEDRLPAALPPGGQVLIYRDGALNLQVRLDGQTVWLTQAAMAELYQTFKQNISLHIHNILEEKELQSEAVVNKYLTTATDGNRPVSFPPGLCYPDAQPTPLPLTLPALTAGYNPTSHNGRNPRTQTRAALRHRLAADPGRAAHNPIPRKPPRASLVARSRSRR